MNIRRETIDIYLDSKLKRRLFWILKLAKNKPSEEHGIVTLDEVIGKLLNEKIEQDYPDLPAMEKRMNALEQQMIVELENQTPKDTK